MVHILTAVECDGLSAVEEACAEALAAGTHSADVILNILARRSDPAPASTVATPEQLASAGPAPRRLRSATTAYAHRPIPSRPVLAR